MIEETRTTVLAEAGELVIERVFDAPRELVFKAWTDPNLLAQWYGPAGFTMPACTIDLRPGGVIHFCMRSAEGYDMWIKGVYSEIIEPERVVGTSYLSDEEGNLVSPAELGFGEDWPTETELIATFEDLDGKTRFTLRQTGFKAAHREGIEGASQGFVESFDRLADYLANA